MLLCRGPGPVLRLTGSAPGPGLAFRQAFLELEPDAIPVEILPPLAINIAESAPRLVAPRRGYAGRCTPAGGMPPTLRGPLDFR